MERLGEFFKKLKVKKLINYSLSKIEAGDNGPLEDLNAKDLNAKLPNEENVNLPEATES